MILACLFTPVRSLRRRGPTIRVRANNGVLHGIPATVTLTIHAADTAPTVNANRYSVSISLGALG